MTFAVFALFAAAFACGLALRVVAVARTAQGSRARIARVASFVVPAVSLACVLVALVPSLLGSSALRPFIVDGATGAALLLVALPSAGSRRFDLARASTAVWFVVVVAGAAVAVAFAPLRAVLAERTPVAFASYSAFAP
jgi:hypothetical protein